jgi:guanylate kinase|tara:strand:- start:12402 stop:12989 length:588 start_codon:yes stop_codon:yes gene_type:complete
VSSLGSNDEKVIVFSAPSGAGKTTIVHALLKELSNRLSFSVSACSRAPRENEIDGQDYHFIGLQGFNDKIENQQFIEWEEVYKDHYYGTLNSELTRIWNENKTVVFDVDVIGGLNLKENFGERALSIFVMPPSIDTLETRLRNRETETEDRIQQRMGKAAEEIALASKFDVILMNDNLKNAIVEAKRIVNQFIES